MGDFIQFIESSAVAVWVRESPSIFAYTSILSLHAMGLAVVVGLGSVVSLRLLGFFKDLPVAPLLRLFPAMWIGFTVNAISGLLLLAANMSNMLANVMFIIKIVLIAIALVNMELLRHRLTAYAQAGQAPSEEISASPQIRALAASAIVLWIAVIIAGRLTAYPNFVAALFS